MLPAPVGGGIRSTASPAAWRASVARGVWPSTRKAAGRPVRRRARASQELRYQVVALAASGSGVSRQRGGGGEPEPAGGREDAEGPATLARRIRQDRSLPARAGVLPGDRGPDRPPVGID